MSTIELNVVGAETSEYFDEERTLFEGFTQECMDFAANWIAENESYLLEIDGYLTLTDEDGNYVIRYKFDNTNGTVNTFI